MSYKPQPRDALAFDILQNMKPEIAQSFFWNFKSRTERREAILAWKAYHDIGGCDQTPVCECCGGSRVGPANSNFAGQPCLVCR